MVLNTLYSTDARTKELGKKSCSLMKEEKSFSEKLKSRK